MNVWLFNSFITSDFYKHLRSLVRVSAYQLSNTSKLAESMEFSSNRLKQVHMQMYNIWWLNVTNYSSCHELEEQCLYWRNMLEWLQKDMENNILLHKQHCQGAKPPLS